MFYSLWFDVSHYCLNLSCSDVWTLALTVFPFLGVAVSKKLECHETLHSSGTHTTVLFPFQCHSYPFSTEMVLLFSRKVHNVTRCNVGAFDELLLNLLNFPVLLKWFHLQSSHVIAIIFTCYIIYLKKLAS